MNHRITECSGLEGTSVGHPAQPPAQAGSPRAGGTAPRPGRSGISPEKQNHRRLTSKCCISMQSPQYSGRKSEGRGWKCKAQREVGPCQSPEHGAMFLHWGPRPANARAVWGQHRARPRLQNFFLLDRKNPVLQWS